jgi:hypothetical protein
MSASIAASDTYRFKAACPEQRAHALDQRIDVLFFVACRRIKRQLRKHRGDVTL